MKIYITGAAGFIGSHLWDYFEKQKYPYEIRGVDNFSNASTHPLNKRVVYGDVKYKADLREGIKWCDEVMHLAAQISVDKSIKNPQETIDTNVFGTLNILELVKKYNKKLIFASSSEVYGSSQTDLMDEKHPLDAQSPYAASKVAGDRLCKSYYDTYDVNVKILRNFNTFGPYQNDKSYGGVIAIFTKRALQGKPLEIYGTGEQVRDYIYIDDAVRAYEFCMDNPFAGQAVNVGSGKTITINELADLIIKITKSKSEIRHIDPRPGEVMRLCADTSKIERMGFNIKTDFEKDLTEYIKWYDSFFKRNSE